MGSTATLFLVVVDGVGGRATSAPALDSNDLKVESAKVHAMGCPRVEVVLNSDYAFGSGRLADRDVLVEGRCSYNGRLVITSVLPDGIRASIACNSPLLRAETRGVLVVLDNIVLDKGISGPAVD